MDESKAIEQVAAAYEKLLRQSGRIQSLEKKLADGTITMKEGAELNDLRAKAFGRALSGSVPGIERGSREGACVSLLKDRCADVDELAQAAQKTALTRQGLNITPPTAPFEEERARKIGHSLEDTTVPDETIQRRARSATENMLNSQYDRNMKKGAETCASAGLKTYIVRDSGSGCCKWCDEVSGKFAYGSEPKDVYRRHDNCTCTVTYESGRGKQNVWSKQTWSKEQEQKYLELRDELKAKKMTAAPDVKKPVRLSEKDIQAIIAKVGGLTNGAKSGIIYSGRVSVLEQAKKRDHKYMITDVAIQKIKNVSVPYLSEEQNTQLYELHKELLRKAKDENKSNETAFLMSLNSFERFSQLGSETKVDIFDNPFAVSMSEHCKEKELFLAHNHPSTKNFSYSDLGVLLRNDCIGGMSVVTNLGDVHILFKTDKYDFDKAYEYIKNIRKNYGDYNEEVDLAIVKDFLKNADRIGIKVI